MLRTLVLCLVALLLPSAVSAQLSVTSGHGTQPTRNNSSSYIFVTGIHDGQPYEQRCEPNAGCTVPNGTTVTHSQLVYDNERERLIGCDGMEPTSEGAECQKANGILRAALQVRLGKLKVTAKAHPDFFGLHLQTSGRQVKLDFVGSSGDYWWTGYSPSFGGTDLQFRNFPAGHYTVHAQDLPGHCQATQSNAGVSLDVPEGGQVELEVQFRANSCQVTIQRLAGTGATIGSITSEPAGISCPAGDGPCTGSFAFGTQVTFTPTGSYNWQVAQGCIPGNAPCKRRIEGDYNWNLTFNTGGGSQGDAAVPDEPDAGTGGDEEDASTPDEGDAATGSGLQDAAASEPDAGVQVDGGPASPTPDDPSDEEEEASTGGGGKAGDDSCSLRPGASGSHAWLALGLLAALLVTRRRRFG